MKKIMITLLFIILTIISYSLYLVYQEYSLVYSSVQKVVIAYNKVYMKKNGFILNAYQSVFEEEGIPWKAVEISSLTTTSAKKLAKTKPVVIFPDGLLQSMPDTTLTWVKEYLDNGGSVAIIYDPGVKTPKGYFRDQAVLADIVGLNYITYKQNKEKAYSKGFIKFNSKEKSTFFQMPPGKVDEDGFLSGYIYGHLQYSFARTELTQAIPEENIFARIVTPDGDEYPAFVIKRYGKGNVLYVNLPLGYLKGYSDDLPLRETLRTFLFQVVGIPHLMNTENGLGSLVINWHIDSNIEYPKIPDAIKNNILNKSLRCSIHITAGDFRDQAGDGFGFDACGRGKESTKMLLSYGAIGSHGGWAHNWFADNLNKNALSPEKIEYYIRKNKTCLEGIAGYPLLEYSAPEGVHPQPETTLILQNLGFNSYYYTGDNGSAPNRTFIYGRMVSPEVIAFPVISLNQNASLYEMKENGIEEDKVQKWLFDCIDYMINNHTTRLFYSHLHDVDNYPNTVQSFLKYAAQKQAEGKLKVAPMSEIAGFFKSFLMTEYSFRVEDGDLHISLKNSAGLKGITIAVPKNKYQAVKNIDIDLNQDSKYYFLTVNDDVKKKFINVNGL
jgi:hypothetical protein